MSDYQLTSAPPLAGYEKNFEQIMLKAPEDFALVSISLPLGGEDTAKTAIKSAFGNDLPEPGKAVKARGGTILFRMGIDQGFALFTHPTPDAEPFIASRLKGAAYTTDQTDVWAALEISGAKARRALERICPLDLHDEAFGIMDVARTVMEHLGVIILRTGADEWLLLSASSSAGTFLHAVEVSVRNIS